MAESMVDALRAALARPASLRIVHYCCEPFGEGTSAPSVNPICVANIEGNIQTFKTGRVSEKEMLGQFFDAVQRSGWQPLIGWNFRDELFGWPALTRRFVELGGPEPPSLRPIDLRAVFDSVYGAPLAERPLLANLAKLNDYNTKGVLDAEGVVAAWRAGETKKLLRHAHNCVRIIWHFVVDYRDSTLVTKRGRAGRSQEKIAMDNQPARDSASGKGSHFTQAGPSWQQPRESDLSRLRRTGQEFAELVLQHPDLKTKVQAAYGRYREMVAAWRYDRAQREQKCRLAVRSVLHGGRLAQKGTKTAAFVLREFVEGDFPKSLVARATAPREGPMPRELEKACAKAALQVIERVEAPATKSKRAPKKTPHRPELLWHAWEICYLPPKGTNDTAHPARLNWQEIQSLALADRLQLALVHLGGLHDCICLSPILPQVEPSEDGDLMPHIDMDDIMSGNPPSERTGDPSLDPNKLPPRLAEEFLALVKANLKVTSGQAAPADGHLTGLANEIWEALRYRVKDAETLGTELGAKSGSVMNAIGQIRRQKGTDSIRLSSGVGYWRPDAAPSTWPTPKRRRRRHRVDS